MEQVVIHKIEPAEFQDLQVFIDSLKSCYDDMMIQKLRKDVESQTGYAALVDSKYMGFILSIQLTQNLGKITWLGVPMENLEHAIAPALLDRVEREFKKKGIHTVRVETKSETVISETDLFLRQFYRMQGFRDKEVRPFYYPDGTEGLVLEKSLID